MEMQSKSDLPYNIYNAIQYNTIQYNIRLIPKYPADTAATELQKYEKYKQ